MCTVIQHPGKFEGETCITRLAYDWAMSGDGEDDFQERPGECGNPLVSVFRGPFSLIEIRDADIPLCDECLAEVLYANKIEFWEDSQGFAYSTIESGG